MKKMNYFSDHSRGHKLLLVSALIALAASILCRVATQAAPGPGERPDVLWMRGGHILDVTSMDYSPDGQLFVSMGDGTGVIKVWRVSDGMLLRTIRVFPSGGYAVKFFNDSQTVAVTGSEPIGGIDTAVIKRVRVSDGQTIWWVPGGRAGVRLYLTLGGDLFLGSGSAEFYRAADGSLHRFSALFYRNSSNQRINMIGAFFNSSFLAENGIIAVSLNYGAGGGDYHPAFVDPNDCYIDQNDGINRCNVVSYFPDLTFGVGGITPDGTQILTYGGPNLMKIYRVSDACHFGTSCQTPPPNPIATIFGARELTFSPDGQTLSIASQGSSIDEYYYFYNTSSWGLKFSQPRIASYATTAFSPDSQIVANNNYPSGQLSSWFARVNFTSVSDGSPVGVLNAHVGMVNSVAFSSDSQLFASADNGGNSSFNDRVVHIWRTSDGTLLTSFVGDPDSVNSIAFSPAGPYLATGGNTSIKLWNVVDGSVVRTFSPNSFAHSVAFSSDGTKLLTGGVSTPRVNLWDVQTGNLIRSFFLNTGSTRAVAISPDGQTMAATDNSFFSTTISFWRMLDGAFLRSVTTPGNVSSIAFSPNSQTLIAGLEEGSGDRTSRVRQWEISTGTVIRDYSGHMNWIKAVAFSPDGSVIMSGGEGIRMWDASTGTQLRYFDDEIGVFPVSSTSGNPNILSVAFAPDGSKFGYGRFDATAVLASYPINQAPVAVASFDQAVIEATGPSGSTVSFDASQSFDPDGSIVTYEWKEGANVIAQGVQVSFPVTLGSHTFVLEVTDDRGATATDTVAVNVVDSTAPTLTLPTDFSVPATSGAGALVTFTASASDLVDGSMNPICSPASGSTFPVGATTVTCTATDSRQNTAQGSFTVTVTSAGPTPTPTPVESIVQPGNPNWHAYEPNTSRVSVTNANPLAGSGSIELNNNPALIKSGTNLGTYGNLNALSFDWFIQSFTDPFTGTRSLPPDIALRFYDYGDPRTFFLHWDTCSPAVGCNSYPIGAWQSTDLLNQLSIQQAEGNIPPASLADIPADAPITEIHIRGSYSFGGAWHGFVDNVTIGFSGDAPTNFNFEPKSQLPDLAGWWRGEGNAVDSAGFNHGWTQGVTFTSGKYGQAFSFDGIDDFASVFDRSSLNMVQHTLGAWIYVKGMNGPYSGIIVKQNPDNSGRNFYLGLTGNRVLHYSIQSGSDYKFLNSNSSIPLNTWTYVAAVYDGNAMRLYINGIEDISLTVGSITPATTSWPLLIGWTNENDVRYFHGDIDEAQVFRRALSPYEVKAIYEGLVAWWKFDQDTTDSINDFDGTPHDGVTFVQGHDGQGFRSGYVAVPNATGFESEGFSVSVWVRSLTAGSPGPYQYVVAKGADACWSSSYSLSTEGEGGLRLRLYDGANQAHSPDAGQGVWDGNWHNVVGTYDGAYVRLYVDGNEVGNGTPSSIQIKYDLSTSQNLLIGAYSEDPGCRFNFTGDIDDVKLFNRALTPIEIKGDITPPVLNASLSPAPNAAGWHSTDPTVTLNAADEVGGVGVREIAYSSTGAQTLPPTIVPGNSAIVQFNTEGESTLTFSATDNVGNASAPQTITIKLDKTLPIITCGSSDGLWHAADVSIPCTSSDSVSGLTNAGDVSFSLVTNVSNGTETANALTSSHTVCDVAGNCAIAGPVAGNLIDKKAPSISFSAPVQGAVYLLNSVVAANYACSDGGAGVSSCIGTVPTGNNIDTSSLGQKSFTVNAVDKVANAVSSTLSYFVKGPTTTKLISNLNPSTYGATITFMANVNSPNGAPTGEVQFFDGSTLIGSASLSSGKAKLTISSLTVGTHQISAVYVGNDQYLSSTSTALAQVVNLAPTSCLLSSSKNPSAYLASVTFSVQVKSNQPGYIPNGIVRFSADGTGSGPLTLDASGTASATFKFLAAGSKNVTVLYAGTSSFATCQASMTQVVKPR